MSLTDICTSQVIWFTSNHQMVNIWQSKPFSQHLPGNKWIEFFGEVISLNLQIEVECWDWHVMLGFLLMEKDFCFHSSILLCGYSCFVWAGIYSNLMMTRKMDPCLKGVYHSTRWFLCLKDIANELMLFIAVYNSKSSYIGLLTWPLTCMPYVAMCLLWPFRDDV